MIATEANDFVIVLSGTRDPTGEIGFDDLAGIAKAMQDLATRVGRFVAGQDGVGRTGDQAVRATRLRLRAVSQGSTKLAVAYGEHGTLDLDVGLESETAGRFWEIVEGVQQGERPAWATPGIADAALQVVDTLSRAAQRVEVAGRGHRASWERHSVQRGPWIVEKKVESDETVTIAGRLEAVDLAAARFRIRDDVGNKIILYEVPDGEQVGPLVGRRAAATGTAIRGPRGQIVGVNTPALTAADLPVDWFRRPRVDLDEFATSAPGPDPDGGVDLTDEEFGEFMAILREV